MTDVIGCRLKKNPSLKFCPAMPMKGCEIFGLSISIRHVMNTIAISFATHAPQTNIPISSSQCAQNFAALQNAVQAGDLAAARGAYAMFWQDVAAQEGPGRLFVPNAQTGHDLQAVGISLSSADMPGARRAFAMFQRDMLAPVQSPPLPALQAYRL
jgi:hypothetical protein